MRNRYTLFFIVLFWGGNIFCIQVNTYAQEIDALSDLSLEELLNTRVSVASKSNLTIANSPSSVTVITHEEMKNLGVTCVEELLNYVAGFVVTRRNNDANPNSNISVRGGLSMDILFLYNGQRINNMYEGMISDMTQFIPIDNIKQIEVIRGPGSALYGSNAFLGVVNIITDDNLNDISVSAGNIGYKEASVNLSTNTNGLQLSAFAQGFSDFGYEYPNLVDKWGHSETTKDPVKGFNAFLSLKYYNFSMNIRHNESQLQNFVLFGTLCNGVNFSDAKQSFINFKYNYIADENLNFDFTAGYLYDYWKSTFEQVPIGIIPTAYNANGKPTQYNAQILCGGPYITNYNIDFNVDGRYKVSGDNELIAGASYEFGQITECSNQGNWNYETGSAFQYYGSIYQTIPGKDFNVLKGRSIFGLYVQDSHNFENILRMTAGIRIDSYSDFGNSINPRLAIIYSTPLNSKIKLMYGKAFRAPNYSQLYDGNNPSLSGNPNLNAVKVRTFEAAYVQEFSNFQGVITFFNSNIIDIITPGRRINPNDPASPHLYENLGTQNVHGLEFEFKSSPVNHFLITFGFSHILKLDGLLIPPNSGSLSINYNNSDFNFNINGLYRDKMDDLPSQDPYIILNSKLSVNISSNIKLKCTVQNLGNLSYDTIGNLMPDNRMPNRGRTYQLGMEITL